MRHILIAAAAIALASITAASQVPHIIWTSLPIQPLTTPTPVTGILNGTGFVAGSQVFVNGQPTIPTLISAASLMFQVNTIVPQLFLPGAATVTVVNPPNVVSNQVALVVQPSTSAWGNNMGTIGFRPPGYTPGQSIQLSMEGVWANVPFTLMADTATPIPVFPFPTAQSHFVLGVAPGTSTFFSVMDGIGIFGPPNPLAVTQSLAPATPPGGGFLTPPFTTPNPPSGVAMSLQAVYPDASVPLGWRLSWTRFPFTF